MSMQRMRGHGTIGLALLLGGCAAVPPSNEEIARLPVVTFGQPAPAERDFVLHFPAQVPIPTDVAIRGNIFVADAHDTLEVKLTREIYAYKQWVSFDRRTWVRGDEAFSFRVQVQVPGYDHPQPGFVRIQMDRKPGAGS